MKLLSRQRWPIETMLQELTETLTCEVNPLGYPKAVLCSICLALMAYNVVAVIKAAMLAVHGPETLKKAIAAYYLEKPDNDQVKLHEAIMKSEGLLRHKAVPQQ